MLTTAYYFLQVVLCSGLMMAYYWLLLRNKRFHQYNRFYLLAITLLAWVVPLIKIKWNRGTIAEEPQVLQLLSVVADNNSQIDASLTDQGFQWSGAFLLGSFYFIVTAIALFYMFRAFARLYRLLKEHSCKNFGDVYIILTNAKGTPFSFFRYIFWNEEIDMRSAAGKQILEHELMHVKQKHSIDKVFMQIVLVAGWFNPFFWLIKKEMDMIHEFIADKHAVSNGDTASLAQMLLTAAYPQQQFSLTNPFFFSPVKRRLQMLTLNKHPRFSYIRRLVVLPLLALVTILFAFRNKEERKDATISVASVIEKVMAAAQPKEEELQEFVPGSDTIIVKDRTPIIVNTDAKGQVTVKALPSSTTVNENSTANVLYIVDGQKADKRVLQTILPNDIASIQVLKNSASTDVYGPEGANGVILITTKNSANLIIDTSSSKAVAGYQVPLVDTIRPRSADTSLPLTEIIRPLGVSGTLQGGSFSGTLSAGTIRDEEDVRQSREFQARNTEIAYAYFMNTPLRLAVRLKDGTMETYDMNSPDSKKRAESKYGKLPQVPVFSSGSAVATLGTLSALTVNNTPNLQATTRGTLANLTVTGNVMATTMPMPQANPDGVMPAFFPGGYPAWVRYIERNLDRDIVKKNGGPPGKYITWVTFSIDENGMITNTRVDRDPGYGAKAEAIKLITKGPKWIPARQNGKQIASVRTEVLVFTVPEDN